MQVLGGKATMFALGEDGERRRLGEVDGIELSFPQKLATECARFNMGETLRGLAFSYSDSGDHSSAHASRMNLETFRNMCGFLRDLDCRPLPKAQMLAIKHFIRDANRRGLRVTASVKPGEGSGISLVVDVARSDE